jgi:hypothetical protein
MIASGAFLEGLVSDLLSASASLHDRPAQNQPHVTASYESSSMRLGMHPIIGFEEGAGQRD